MVLSWKGALKGLSGQSEKFIGTLLQTPSHLTEGSLHSPTIRLGATSPSFRFVSQISWSCFPVIPVDYVGVLSSDPPGASADFSYTDSGIM